MRLLRNLLLALALLLLLPILIVQFLGGSIARTVVGSVNERLQGEIQVGDYNLSLLTAFPKLSVDLAGVVVEGSDGSQLLVAEEVDFKLGLSSLFGTPTVSGVVIRDGTLRLLIDEDGNGNYNLAGYESVEEQYADEGAGAGATSFELEEAVFDDVTIVYQDAQLQTDAVLRIDDATLSGDFGAARYVLDTEGELTVDYLDQEGTRYLSNRELTVEAIATVTEDEGYFFQPLRLEAGDLEISIDGNYRDIPAGQQLDLRITSNSGSLDDALQLIPPAYAESLAELETRGELDLSATVVGQWTARTYPRMDGRLEFRDGRIESPRTRVGARDIELVTTFAYVDGPGGGLQTFDVERFTGKFRNSPFDIALRMEDLNDPRIEFRANGSLPLSTLPAFFEEDTEGEAPMISNGDGFLRFDNLQLTGRYEDMIRPRRMGSVNSSGTLTFDDAELTINGRDIEFPSGTLSLDDNRFTLTDLIFEAPGTELRMSGRATNLIPVLFADSLNTQDAKLEFEAELSGKSLDIDELLALSGPSAEEIEAAERTGAQDSLRAKTIEQRAQITDLLDGRFEADIEEWNWDLLEGKNFRGQLLFKPKELDVIGLTEAMDGNFRVDGQVFFQQLQRMDLRITAEGVDVEQFFAQNDNFEQEVLVADNLEGDMNGNMFVQLYYNAAGDFDYDKLYVIANLSIEDGELHDFEMLENFAFALKEKDLARVRFTRLQNFFEIREQIIYIPAMFIQSSAMNMTLSGNHSFNQYLEYYIKVNAGQVVANKISRHDRELEVLPARNGLFNLYYTVKGPLETFEVESDKRAVKADFRRSEFRRDRIRTELQRLFAQPIELPEESADSEDVAGRE